MIEVKLTTWKLLRIIIATELLGWALTVMPMPFKVDLAKILHPYFTANLIQARADMRRKFWKS